MDTHYENLTRLYLRLKGFLVSNLILHSNKDGDLRSELDIVAVRMPFHSQDYRWVHVEDYLECSDSNIEIIIGDVKNYSKLEDVEFNRGLRRYRDSIKQLIDWLGVYENVDDNVIDKFERYLNLHREKDWDGFAQFNEVTTLGKFRFKFTFFCPSLPKWNNNGFKYINGEELIDFVWECLNETKKIETCSRRYSIGRWNELEEYVAFFKGKDKKVTLQEFEDTFKNKIIVLQT